MIITTTLLRKCTKCQRTLSFEQFYTKGNSCKQCQRLKNKLWRLKNPEKNKQKNKQFIINYPGYSEAYYKDNASNMKRYRKKYVLKAKKIVFHKYSNGTNNCYYCGESRFNRLTIDHMDGKGGKRRLTGEPQGSTLYAHLVQKGFPLGY